MDGKGAWRDNVFIERLVAQRQYEEVYLRAYESVGQARDSIGRYLDFYNGRRPIRAFDDMTRIKPTHLRRSAWRPNPAALHYRRGESVRQPDQLCFQPNPTDCGLAAVNYPGDRSL